MTDIKLKVGYWYGVTGGNRIRILEKLSYQGEDLFLGDDDLFYLPSGGRRVFWSDGTSTNVDIGIHTELPIIPLSQDKSFDNLSLVDSFDEMRVWGEEIFGPVEAKRIVARAKEEFDLELVPEAEHGFTEKVAEEAADVVIILTRVPGLGRAIQKKMAKNRARTWNLKGDGTGYHVKSEDTPEKQSWIIEVIREGVYAKPTEWTLTTTRFGADKEMSDLWNNYYAHVDQKGLRMTLRLEGSNDIISSIGSL